MPPYDPTNPQPEESFSLDWAVDDLRQHLLILRGEKDKAHKAGTARRNALSPDQRASILRKTGGRCHICGGVLDPDLYWEADHVLRHFAGGGDDLDNFLAAHGLCNTCRWHHSPEEMQWILKIGVWARRQMEGSSPLGQQMLTLFYEKERNRERRKKAYKQAITLGIAVPHTAP